MRRHFDNYGTVRHAPALHSHFRMEAWPRRSHNPPISPSWINAVLLPASQGGSGSKVSLVFHSICCEYIAMKQSLRATSTVSLSTVAAQSDGTIYSQEYIADFGFDKTGVCLHSSNGFANIAGPVSCMGALGIWVLVFHSICCEYIAMKQSLRATSTVSLSTGVLGFSMLKTKTKTN